MSTEHTNEEDFDVLIVGYGPTGMALAYWLGAAGHRTAVLERWPDLYHLPRAGHVDGEVMRLFQRMGIADEIAADSSITGNGIIKGSDGNVLATIEAESSDQGWEAHYSLYQPNLERSLDRRVRGTGAVTVMQGWAAEQIERTAEGRIRLSVKSGTGHDGTWHPTGSSKVLTGSWLIGADGANSVVADYLNVDVEDLGYRDRALVVFAERLDPTVGASMPVNEIGMIPERPYVAFRESGKRFARWEFLVHPHETTEEMSKPEKAWELIARWGFSPQNSRLVRHTVFDFVTLVSRTWGEGNILLAGDAAHRMPPFQGQGMCSGQRDAAALAWRLDLVLRGLADESVLESYVEERRPHVLAVTRNSAERGQLFWVTDPEQARQRDAKMAEAFKDVNVRRSYGDVPRLTDGLIFRDSLGAREPAGRLSPQFHVLHNGTKRLLDDIVGSRWLLLAKDQRQLDNLAPADLELLLQLGTVRWALDQSVFTDVDGEYTRWLDELECDAVLIRPDSYVFGGAAGSEQLGEVLTSLREQLHVKEALV